jgi:hypothetical protein
LHALPSEHDVPLPSTLLTHTPALQVSDVHGLASLQFALVVHDWHPEIGVFVQPLSALHVSFVHALLSLQLSAAPAVHVPP